MLFWPKPLDLWQFVNDQLSSIRRRTVTIRHPYLGGAVRSINACNAFMASMWRSSETFIAAVW